MEPGRIEFLDEDGSTLAGDRPVDQPDVDSGGRRRGRWPVLLLTAVIVAVCGGVLWHQHSGGGKHSTPAPVAAPRTITVDPLNGEALYGGVRPTGELLAEAEQKQEQLQCMNQVQVDLSKMIASYQSARDAGGSVREAERAARAALADVPRAGPPGASYDAIFRAWLINRTALSRVSGERLSIDMTGLCPG